jgi:hypothetical protein
MDFTYISNALFIIQTMEIQFIIVELLASLELPVRNTRLSDLLGRDTQQE